MRIIASTLLLFLFIHIINCYVLSSSSLKALSQSYEVKDNNDSLVNWYNPLLQKFRDERNKSATYEHLAVPKLREQASSNLMNRIFKPRREALETLVGNAEDAARGYDWPEIITSVSYKDSNDFAEYSVPDVVVDSASSFPRSVNFSFSTVHVPIETYVGPDSVERDALQGIDWTKKLDQFFIEGDEEARNNPDKEDLLWQYFGSQEGFVRHYPGSEWVQQTGKVDLYDSRRRPWYNQGSSPPKDVLILIDTSGSTAGQTLYLMTLTTQKLMDTLGEDDFVQVANFSNEKKMDEETARIGPDCFPNFVQATTFNKRMIMDYVMALNEPINAPQGQANYSVGLEYAYKSFEEFEKSDSRKIGMGTSCTKIIILLTDGGVVQPEDLIYKHDKDSKYLIFTYAMGKTPTPLDAVRWLACRANNGGYFSSINSIGTINKGVQHFTARLGAILSHRNDQQSLLSSLYRDEWGLGMLMTLTMPVFNRTDPDDVSLLGVMGLDVATDEFDKFIPFRELGPLSYIIVINHNGFVVKHPLLKTQQLWDIEPPSIDILDAEAVKNDGVLKDIEWVRNSLLDRATLSKQFDDVGAVLQSGDNYAYFIYHTQKYFTADIQETRYRLAIATPTIINNVLKVSYAAADKPSVAVFEELSDEMYEVTISKWNYCEGVFKLANNQSSLLENITKLIKDDVSCDADMVNHLLWDASVVNASRLSSLVKEGGIEVVSLTTAGGLSVMYPQSEEDNSKFRLENHYSNPATKRAFANRDEFIYSAEYRKDRVSVEVNTTGPTISIYKALTEEDGAADRSYIFGVIGMTVNNTLLTEALRDVEDEGGNKLCDSSADNLCLLLDEGGFIITDNSPSEEYSHIGRWLGAVDTSIMSALYNESDGKSIYNRHKFYDYQATCIHNWLAESSSAPRLPSLGQVAEMLATQFTATLAVLYNSFIMSGTEAVEPLRFGQEYETCTMISYQYYYNNKDDLDREMSSCDRIVQTAKVDGTNMILVIAAPAKGSCDDTPTLPQAPQKIEPDEYLTENPSVCERHLRRRVPLECNNEIKSGFPHSCEGCRQASVSVLLVFGALVIRKLLD